MIVLSLFDGMSCGHLALDKAGIKVDKYYASEIDKYAIQVTMANYPNTIQLGDVTNVNPLKLDKIDLLIGGSPCQSFSFAGKRKGMSTTCMQEINTLNQYLELKSEGFEFDGQSYLFWEYMRILKEVQSINPNVLFLLENVEMGEKWEKVLSKAIGVNGIHINSSLVSAQNRQRIYWTNIGQKPSGLFGYMESIIEQPKDRGILLKDILQDSVDDKYYISQKGLDYIYRNDRNIAFQMDENDNKSKCIVAMFKAGIPYNQIVVHNMQRRSPDRPSLQKNPNAGGSGHLSRNDGKTYCLDSANTQSIEIKSGTYRTFKDESGLRENKSGKAGSLMARAREDGSGQNCVEINKRIRRLTPLECERLQTVPDNYTNFVSDSQRYKMLGNGWTIDVIAHIFNYI